MYVDKEELIKFWKSSHSGSGSRKFLEGFLQHCEIGHFPQCGSYLWKSWSDLHENFTTSVYPSTGKTALNFESHSDSESVLAEVCALQVLLFCKLYSRCCLPTITTLMPSSHRRHRQDKTVLSCLIVLSCLRCELNWRQVKTVGDWKFRNSFVQSRNAVWTESCLVLWSSFQFACNVVIYCDVIFGNWVKTTVLKCVHTADKTGQNCSVSNTLKTVCDCRELSSHRRQDKTRVGVGGVNWP